METKEIKKRVIEVLYGTTSSMELTGEEIAYVVKNLPLVDNEGNKTSELDFSQIVFNHKSEDFVEAIGVKAKGFEKTLTRKLEDICDFEDDESKLKQSEVLEKVLKTFTMHELVYLVGKGLVHVSEFQAKKALMEMIKSGILKHRQDPDITED